jgi:3D (Asp-Asp-Asp) domain-containing protein
MCDTGCTGFTKTEIDVRHTIYHRELRVVAVDPKVIPLWSTLEIRLADGTMFKAIAVDTGGLIKGRKIDVLVAREKDAWDFGRQGVKVQLIDNEETIR